MTYLPPCDEYLKVPNWLFDLGLNAGDRFVYAGLLELKRRHVSNPKNDPPTIAGIVARVKVSRRSVIESLDRLERTGLVTRERRFGAKSTYLLRPPPLPTGAESAPVQDSHPCEPRTPTGAESAPEPVQNPHHRLKGRKNLRIAQQAVGGSKPSSGAIKKQIAELEAPYPDEHLKATRDALRLKHGSMGPVTWLKVLQELAPLPTALAAMEKFASLHNDGTFGKGYLIGTAKGMAEEAQRRPNGKPPAKSRRMEPAPSAGAWEQFHREIEK